jgi:hypothetical protein
MSGKPHPHPDPPLEGEGESLRILLLYHIIKGQIKNAVFFPDIAVCRYQKACNKAIFLPLFAIGHVMIEGYAGWMKLKRIHQTRRHQHH